MNIRPLLCACVALCSVAAHALPIHDFTVTVSPVSALPDAAAEVAPGPFDEGCARWQCHRIRVSNAHASLNLFAFAVNAGPFETYTDIAGWDLFGFPDIESSYFYPSVGFLSEGPLLLGPGQTFDGFYFFGPTFRLFPPPARAPALFAVAYTPTADFVDPLHVGTCQGRLQRGPDGAWSGGCTAGAAVPEPASLALIGLAAGGIGVRRLAGACRRRRTGRFPLPCVTGAR